MAARKDFVLRGAGILVVAGVLAGGGSYIVGGGSEPSADWAGTFDCYGAEDGCWTPATCTSTISSNLTGAISGAAAGAVICLNNGTYSSTNVGVTKSPRIIVQPASGQSPTVSMDIKQFNGMTVQGIPSLSVDAFAANRNLTLSHNDMSDSWELCTSDGCGTSSNVVSDANVLIDGNTFTDLGFASHEGRLNIWGSGDYEPPTGITISNNIFNNTGSPSGNDPGCSDGIQIVGNARGAVIGPGNLFRNLFQGSCAPHVDPIQGYGDTHTQIIGNWFDDNEMSAMWYDDGGQSNMVWSNNVFEADNRPAMAACPSCTVSHNVFVNTALDISTKAGDSTTSTVDSNNNVFLVNPPTDQGSPQLGTLTENHNLCLATDEDCDQGSDLYENPVLMVGGSSSYTSFDSFYDYELAAGSAGYHSGTGGLSRGLAEGSLP